MNEENDVRWTIADVMVKLTEKQSYNSITVSKICQMAPVSRNTFYYYFENKDSLAQWIVSQHYQKYCYPIFRVYDKETAAQAFFTYVEKFREFYTALYRADQGQLLMRLLYTAYGYALESENVREYSKPLHNTGQGADPEICRRYTNSGTAAVVTDWVGSGMKESCRYMGKNLCLLLTTSFENIRDYYLY